MDGTAIGFPCAVTFLAYSSGITFTAGQQIVIGALHVMTLYAQWQTLIYGLDVCCVIACLPKMFSLV